ncbi:hypothetical protein KHU50_011114 [Colletotrichum sp. SAR 10_65]|nr:hypothetical protein K4K51_011729 [Colletotrichum sp. SAR 10_75]KAI8195082.1 hypothetical protein KHU50_011114 [Colletotrichum sp. SAR 10_65]KAI8210997.1 hypothetical protein K4K52_011339 [Colletotrichum sp. SAR 10_76]KAJ5003909.1 hypothetical protein K4K48_011008 [Colletotrichum sp. SAR 10_66]
MRYTPIFLAALAAAAPAAVPGVEITNVSAKTLSNNTLTYDFDVLDGTNRQTVHCNAEWDAATRNTAVTCSVPEYTASIYFPAGISGIQDWVTFIGVEGRSTRYLAQVQTGTSDYVCGHSGTDDVLSQCFTAPEVKIRAVEAN